MLSPPISSSTHESTSQQPAAISSRRRGLSYLRALSANRLSSGSTPPATADSTSRTSPRSYFTRSISYNEQQAQQQPPSSRPRSSSRPNESTSVRPGTAANNSTRALSPTPEVRRSQSHSRVPSSAGLNDDVDMARHRTTQAPGRRTVSSRNDPTNPMARNRSQTVTETSTGTGQAASRNASGTNGSTEEKGEQGLKGQLPTIRFYPHHELGARRQSLQFTAVSRTLPEHSSIIRVGRYSDRENVPVTNPNAPSDAPVGFKSKVVSRKHCEFSYVDGIWHIKDVASSSGTFLNHIRLSQPNVESRLYPVKDGDIVQLGIDFRGGEEMIFRCVKIRLECNRPKHKRPNNFNKARHAQLQSLSKDQTTGSENSGECAICLGAVLPCQSLFVAPCAHVWHYKCIRPMLEGANSTYPQFQCPNCRAYTDLSAEVDLADEDMNEWMRDAPDDDDGSAVEENQEEMANGTNPHDETVQMADDNAHENAHENGHENGDAIVPDAPPASINDGTNQPREVVSPGLLARRHESNPASPEIASVNAIDMPGRQENEVMGSTLQPELTRTVSTNAEEIIAGEGPLTPRNNAGPFVFDGSAGRDARRLTVPSIHAE